MKKQFLVEAIAFLLSILLLYAGMVKAFDFQKFTVQIDQSPLLTGYGKILPPLVISSELILAIILWIPRVRLIGFSGAFSLMTMFTVYIIAILRFADYVPCSCGGMLEMLSWRQHMLFNIFFAFLAGAGVLLESSESKNVATTISQP